MISTNLLEVLEHYDGLADTDAIYAQIPFSPDSRTVLADEDDFHFAAPEGYDFFVGVNCIQGILNDFSTEKLSTDEFLKFIGEQETKRVEMNRHLDLNGGQFSADYLLTLLTELETINEEAKSLLTELSGKRVGTKDV